MKPGAAPEIVKVLGDRAGLQKKVRKGDWNVAHIVAQGNLLRHFANDVLMSEVRDEDPEKRSMKGLLGVKVHTGPPMKIEFRNIRLKRLADTATVPPVMHQEIKNPASS